MAASDDPTPPPRLKGDGIPARVARQYIWRRMNVENEHYMGVIVGREGSGKSHTAMSICEAVDPTFTAERVFFNPADLVEAFRSSDLGAGNMVMLDEAGVGLGNRSWYDKEQILLNQTLQTVRDENMGVLFTLPRLNELDSQTIGRLHAILAMKETYPSEGWAKVSWKNVSVPREDQRDKTYKKYPRMRVNGFERRITSISVDKPPEDLAEAYEERKEAFKQDLYDEVIEAHDESEDDGETDLQAVATEIAQDIQGFVSVNGSTKEPYINKDLIRVEYGLSHSDARAVKSMLESQFGKEDLTGSD